MAAGRWRRRRCVARRASADGKTGGGARPRIGELARGSGCVPKMSWLLEGARWAGRTGVIGMLSRRVPEMWAWLFGSPRGLGGVEALMGWRGSCVPLLPVGCQ